MIVGPENKLKNKGTNVECLLATSPGLPLGLPAARWPGAESPLREAPFLGVSSSGLVFWLQFCNMVMLKVPETLPFLC